MSNTYYLPSHEYVRVDGNIGYIGITPFAASQLGNVVFVDMPEQGDDVVKGQEFGAIESVKAASDLFSPSAVLSSRQTSCSLTIRASSMRIRWPTGL